MRKHIEQTSSESTLGEDQSERSPSDVTIPNEPAHSCYRCKSEIAIEKWSCPHCGALQFTSRVIILLYLFAGLLLLPITVWAVFVAIKAGFFTSIEGYSVGALTLILLVLNTTAFVLISYGYRERRKAIHRHAQKENP